MAFYFEKWLDSQRLFCVWLPVWLASITNRRCVLRWPKRAAPWAFSQMAAIGSARVLRWENILVCRPDFCLWLRHVAFNWSPCASGVSQESSVTVCITAMPMSRYHSSSHYITCIMSVIYVETVNVHTEKCDLLHCWLQVMEIAATVCWPLTRHQPIIQDLGRGRGAILFTFTTRSTQKRSSTLPCSLSPPPE